MMVEIILITVMEMLPYEFMGLQGVVITDLSLLKTGFYRASLVVNANVFSAVLHTVIKT